METEAGAESFRSEVLTVVLKLEPTSKSSGEFVKTDFRAPLQTS